MLRKGRRQGASSEHFQTLHKYFIYCSERWWNLKWCEQRGHMKLNFTNLYSPDMSLGPIEKLVYCGAQHTRSYMHAFSLMANCNHLLNPVDISPTISPLQSLPYSSLKRTTMYYGLVVVEFNPSALFSSSHLWHPQDRTCPWLCEKLNPRRGWQMNTVALCLKNCQSLRKLSKKKKRNECLWKVKRVRQHSVWPGVDEHVTVFPFQNPP